MAVDILNQQFFVGFPGTPGHNQQAVSFEFFYEWYVLSVLCNFGNAVEPGISGFGHILYSDLVKQLHRLVVLNKKLFEPIKHFPIPFAPGRVFEEQLVFAKNGRNQIKRDVPFL